MRKKSVLRKRAAKKWQRKEKVEHKTFWISIAAVVFVGFLVIFSSVDTPTGRTIQPINFVSSGNAIHLAVQDVKGVSKITIPIRKDTKGVTMRVEQMPVSWDFSGLKYSEFKASLSDDSFANHFGEVKVDLRLQINDMKQANLLSDNVQLFKDGKEVPLMKTGKNDAFYYFTANVESFSGEYLIGRQDKVAEPVVKPPIVEPEVQQPVVVEPEVVMEEKQEKKGFFAGIANFFKNLFS